jgi:hypothetical protein
MTKEIIKANIVDAPTLFIGVGGTGCGIIRMVAEMCRPEEVENINFVCLDTNVNDLSSVAKSKARIYYVQTSNTQTVGDYLNYDRDAMENWFPKNAVMYDKTVSEGAGQVRAISRLALNATIKTGKIQPLYDAIDDLFRKNGKAMKQAMRIVFVSTASGGTGSGILLPLSMFVRDYVQYKYPNSGLIVRSLILLPETLDSVINSTAEKESQRRNAYATIKELNSFMMKGSGFLDIDPDLRRYRDLHIDFPMPGTDERKSLSLLPFDFCFLMDGQNAEDSTLVSLQQYKVQAAQALYEQNIGPLQKGAFSLEDNIIKELSNPGNFGRNRFGGIGASVLRYPYADIADYIAYDWAIGSIGGEGEAAKWSKYDNEFEIKFREAQKKGLAYSEMPKRAEIYTRTLGAATDTFSKDLRNKYLKDANRRVTTYFNALADEMHRCLGDNPVIRATRDAANGLAQNIDYKDDSKRGKARENLGLLRDYEAAVRINAKKMAESAAEAIFHNENKTISEKKPFTIEQLLKNPFGEICHPNAARYMLYLIKTEFDKRVKTTDALINDTILSSLQNYSPDADNASGFDVKFNGKKQEKSIDDLCAAEKAEGQDPSIIERMGGYEKIYAMINSSFVDYYDQITKFGNQIAELEAYRLGSEYVGELCRMYEQFYHTFGEKVSALVRRQDDLVDSLKFVKGDSILNICASRPMLQELSKATKTQSEEGSMLDSELNGKVFDAVKANVAFEREIRNADIVEEDRRIDIFDDILLGYFRENVRRTCDAIDLNIIEAIAMENRLQARIKTREEQGGDEKLFDKVTAEDNLRHIREIISVGQRLAAPGIQRIINEEPREINLCAYNRTLLNMRSYRMTDLITKGDAVDTVSRYELHFFNALYNLTPDKLKKFACPTDRETGVKNAGLYHNAYTSYSKQIGPDSTKNMMISTHIDKRWDSIAAMPALDFSFQKRQMMKVHQAMVYGLVHGAIIHKYLSPAAGGKKVYKYENSEERDVDMVVSNGTLCDEFYEILDALYISSAIVEDMEIIKDKKRARDKVRKSNYVDTAFAKEVSEFNLEALHEGQTSLLEIPMAYYNSLPNSKRYASEISSLVDAVIKTFQDELSMWEGRNDAKFILCNVLRDQFTLFIANFKKYEILNQGRKAADDPVVDIIFRKVKKAIETTPEPDDYEQTLEGLRALIYA